MYGIATKFKRENMSWMLLVCLLIFVQCKGPSGSEGSAGPQGPEGKTGAVGPAGEDGSIMHAGKEDPKEDVGDSGDYYLNRNTGELYGPKNDKGWGVPISLKGPSGNDGKDGADGQDGKDGKDGQDGSQILSGTSKPDKFDDGNIGDFYLDTDDYKLYGPKYRTSGDIHITSWGRPISLKGTANVMYSNWIRSPQKWKRGATNNDRLRYFDIAANDITQEVLDQAIVNVYLQTQFGSIYPLPFSKGSIPNIDLSIYFELEPQNLRIAYFDPDNRGTDPGATNIVDKFRYVIIPGGVKISSANIKNMTYQEVKKRFGIHK